MPTVPPASIRPAISRAAMSGATTGLAWSWARAVVANSSAQSATACATVSNSSTRSRIWSAPAAARCALILGQPSRGLTIRSRERAKLPIARAAMPIFSPSCGSTRITTGPVSSMPDLVLSVPEPDIASLSDSTSEHLESSSEEPRFKIARTWPHPSAGLKGFSSNLISLETLPDFRSKLQDAPADDGLRLPAFGYAINHKEDEAAKPTRGRFNGPRHREAFDAPQMVTGDCRRGFDFGRRRAGPSDADCGRHQNRGYPLSGCQGQHHERPALHPGERRRPDPAPGIGLHRAVGPAIPNALAVGKAVPFTARSLLRAAFHHRRDPVRAAARHLRCDRHLQLAAHRLEPARRVDLRPVRHLVCGGGHRDAGGVLSRRIA